MPRVRKIAPPVDDAPSSPPDFPPIRQDDVAAWVGEAAMRRGMPYVEGALFDTRRSERTLKASCQGTAVQPYRVAATLDERGIADDDCSCPVGGRCKHVAALLLAWIDDPEMFVEVESTETALQRRDKAELITLIRRMLARNPELETLLELPIPGATTPRPLDPARIRHQVISAFRAASDDWSGASAAADALEPLVQLGDDYAEAGDWRNAVIVYQTIAQAVTEHYEEVQDEGELSDVVELCVEGLTTCLNRATDSTQRESVLRALFEIYRWDLEYGGIGMVEEAKHAMLGHTKAEERRLVANWTREIAPSHDKSGSNWRSTQVGSFLLELTGDDLGDEEFLRLGREHGLQDQIVERLLVRERFEEAEAEAGQASDYKLLQLADLFRQHGQTERAERLVREHQPAGRFQREYVSWLLERARERGDEAEMLALTETLFWLIQQPVLYDQLKTLAEKTGRWNELRSQILFRLERDRHFALLTEIHLRERDIDAALIAVRQATERTNSSGESLRLMVANAAEASHPREAITLYREAAEQFIGAQGRENYISAARLLARVRQLYIKLNEQATWDEYIADVRTRYPRLRALREELDRANL